MRDVLGAAAVNASQPLMEAGLDSLGEFLVGLFLPWWHMSPGRSLQGPELSLWWKSGDGKLGGRMGFYAVAAGWLLIILRNICGTDTGDRQRLCSCATR